MTRTIEPDSSVRPASGGPAFASRVPARARGVELLGRMQGSGYREPPYLVRRGDGQTLQVTPLLHEVLEAIDGRRTLDEIGALVSESVGRRVDGEDVAFLIEEKLGPLGVLRAADGSEPRVKKLNPLLAIRGRLAASSPATTWRLTTPFVWLFSPIVVAVITTVFLGASGWLLFEKGLGQPLRAVLYDPGLLLLVFALTVVSGAFHEIGHASACRYGGARPGVMGAGLYLVWPVFYTDVTDSYRLPRAGRLRTDLGGLYFNAVFAVAMLGVWAVTSWDAILILIPVQLVQMLHQLPPFLRLDGYHILADLTGVPDLFARIKPTLLSALPWRRTEKGARELQPWARRVVTAWVVIVIPLLLFSLVVAIFTLPRVAATAWDSIGRQWDGFATSWNDGDPARAGVRVLSILAIALPVASITYLLTRFTRRAALRAARQNAHDPRTRFTASVVAFAMVAVTVWGLWPNGQYRPIGPNERGTVLETVASIGEDSGGRDSTPVGALDSVAVTRAVNVPDLTGAPTVPLPTSFDPSVPITRPPIDVEFHPPPNRGPGNNQAIAINTEDGSSVFEVAFSMVWVTGGVSDEVNEAYALASCLACTTVAVAFQLVLLSTDVNVVVPQNVAVALNVACALCVTFAFAAQLVITVAQPLTLDQQMALMDLWARLEALEDRIDEMPLAALQAEIQAIEAEIIQVLDATDDGTASDPVTPEETTTTSTEPTTSTTTAPEATTTTSTP